MRLSKFEVVVCSNRDLDESIRAVKSGMLCGRDMSAVGASGRMSGSGSGM